MDDFLKKPLFEVPERLPNASYSLEDRLNASMPQQLQWTEAEARLVLHAIRNVGTAGGVLPLPSIHAEMMEAIQNHVLHS